MAEKKRNWKIEKCRCSVSDYKWRRFARLNQFVKFSFQLILPLRFVLSSSFRPYHLLKLIVSFISFHIVLLLGQLIKHFRLFFAIFWIHWFWQKKATLRLKRKKHENPQTENKTTLASCGATSTRRRSRRKKKMFKYFFCCRFCVCFVLWSNRI